MTQAEADKLRSECMAKITPAQGSAGGWGAGVWGGSMEESMRVTMAQSECARKYAENIGLIPKADGTSNTLTSTDFGSRFNQTQTGSASGARQLTEAEKEALKQKSAAAAAPAATATGSYIVLGVVGLVVFGVIYFITRK